MTEDNPDADEGEHAEARTDDPDETPLSELRRRIEARRGRSNGRAGDDGATGSAADAPLSGLASDVRARRETDPTGESPFEAVDVETVDGEALWDAVVDGTEGPSEPSPEATVSADDTAESADTEECVVDKREFCQRCRFFSAPPAVACEHEGTDIVELVDGDRFRVRGCPMVDDEDDGWRAKLAEE